MTTTGPATASRTGSPKKVLGVAVTGYSYMGAGSLVVAP